MHATVELEGQTATVPARDYEPVKRLAAAIFGMTTVDGPRPKQARRAITRAILLAAQLRSEIALRGL